MMFGRIHYADKSHRVNTFELQTIWQSSSSLGSVADIFTEVLYNHYSPPRGFCFAMKCTDPPIMVSYWTWKVFTVMIMCFHNAGDCMSHSYIVFVV